MTIPNDGYTHDLVIQDIPLGEIHADEDFNCRGRIVPLSVRDLAESMRERKLQNPVQIMRYKPEEVARFKKRWKLISGYRRFTAASILEWPTIPAVIYEWMSDVDARIMNLGENLQREDLNPLQEAKSIAKLFDDGLGQEAIAKRLNKSRGWVQVRQIILQLPEEIQLACAARVLSQQQIRDIASIPNTEAQFAAFRDIKDRMATGEKKVKVKKRKPSVYAKVRRERDEIFEMMEHLMDHIDPCFVTRAMSWCAGEINTVQLLTDFKKYAKEEWGVDYEIPESILPSVPIRANAGGVGEGAVLPSV